MEKIMGRTHLGAMSNIVQMAQVWDVEFMRTFSSPSYLF